MYWCRGGLRNVHQETMIDEVTIHYHLLYNNYLGHTYYNALVLRMSKRIHLSFILLEFKYQFEPEK